VLVKPQRLNLNRSGNVHPISASLIAWSASARSSCAQAG
jgi:hypothetical protein